MKKDDFTKLKHKIFSDRKFAEYYVKKDTASDIAQMVLKTRVLRGITQKELAERIGTKQPSIARIENGHLPSIQMLEKITKALNLTFIVLI